jgi:hypothetical protein
MKIKLNIPFFNKRKTFSECVEDIRESDNFYMETGHSGFSQQVLREPLVSQQTRHMLNGKTNGLYLGGQLVSEIPTVPFYDRDNNPIPDIEEVLETTNEWVQNVISKHNPPKDNIDLSFPTFKESLDLKKEDESIKDARLRAVYLKKRVRREMRKEKKREEYLLRQSKKTRLRDSKATIELENNDNPNKKYVDLSLKIINESKIIDRHNNNGQKFYIIKFETKGKYFELKFMPQYKYYDYDSGYPSDYDHRYGGFERERGMSIENVLDGEIIINEIKTENYNTNLIHYSISEYQSNYLNKAIKKRTNHIKRRTLYEIFENFKEL